MNVNYKIATDVTSDPITLAQAKIYLAVPTTCTEWDAMITAFITAAREVVEARTNRKLGVATINCVYDKFYPEMWMELAEIATVESVKYYSDATTLTTLATSAYEYSLNEFPALLRPVNGTSFPGTYTRYDAVTIQVKTGTNYPKALLTAMYMIITHWFENRQDVITGHSVAEIPQTSVELCQLYKYTIMR